MFTAVPSDWVQTVSEKHEICNHVTMRIKTHIVQWFVLEGIWGLTLGVFTLKMTELAVETHETSTWQKSKLCIFKHPLTGQSVCEVDVNFGSVWVWGTENPTLETCRGGGFKTPFNHPTGTCAGLLLMPLILTVIPLVFSCLPQLPLLFHCDWTMGDNYSI